MYEIGDRRENHARYACGFYSRDKAQRWIDEQRGMLASGRCIWMDKTITADDFVIKETRAR